MRMKGMERGLRRNHPFCTNHCKHVRGCIAPLEVIQDDITREIKEPCERKRRNSPSEFMKTSYTESDGGKARTERVTK